MELIKFGHACVRFVKDGRSIVADPGNITREADALTGAEAILITHEHPDHVDVERVRGALEADPSLVVYTCPGVARLFPELAERVRVLTERQTAQVAGFTVTAVGRKHHYSHPDTAPVDNVGFLLDGEVLYTGDALPHQWAPTVLVTGDAPWLTIPDLLAYLRVLRPERALIVHDGLLNDDGLAVLDEFLQRETEVSGREVRRLSPGEKVHTGQS